MSTMGLIGADHEVLRLLGQGAYGRAVLCREVDSQRLVVIKQVLLSPAATAAAQKEATILASLEHPNITAFFGAFTETDDVGSLKLNICMEYCDAGDLEGAIKRRREAPQPFEEQRVMGVLVQLALALKYVHARKILHRDIKPQNVFLTSDNLVKLGDFGVAKCLNNTRSMARTQTGTPYYLSPEIFNDEEYNASSDMWSLGVVLFELATLKLPFQAASLGQLAVRVLKNEAPVPFQCSAEMRDLLSKMLCKRPCHRPSAKRLLREPFVSRNARLLLDVDPTSSKRRGLLFEDDDVDFDDTDPAAPAKDTLSNSPPPPPDDACAGNDGAATDGAADGAAEEAKDDDAAADEAKDDGGAEEAKDESGAASDASASAASDASASAQPVRRSPSRRLASHGPARVSPERSRPPLHDKPTPQQLLHDKLNVMQAEVGRLKAASARKRVSKPRAPAAAEPSAASHDDENAPHASVIQRAWRRRKRSAPRPPRRRRLDAGSTLPPIDAGSSLLSIDELPPAAAPAAPHLPAPVHLPPAAHHPTVDVAVSEVTIAAAASIQRSWRRLLPHLAAGSLAGDSVVRRQRPRPPRRGRKDVRATLAEAAEKGRLKRAQSEDRQAATLAKMAKDRGDLLYTQAPELRRESSQRRGGGFALTAGVAAATQSEKAERAKAASVQDQIKLAALKGSERRKVYEGRQKTLQRQLEAQFGLSSSRAVNRATDDDGAASSSAEEEDDGSLDTSPRRRRPAAPGEAPVDQSVRLSRRKRQRKLKTWVPDLPPLDGSLSQLEASLSQPSQLSIEPSQLSIEQSQLSIEGSRASPAEARPEDDDDDDYCSREDHVGAGRSRARRRGRAHGEAHRGVDASPSFTRRRRRRRLQRRRGACAAVRGAARVACVLMGHHRYGEPASHGAQAFRHARLHAVPAGLAAAAVARGRAA